MDVIINFECDRSIDVGTPEFLRKDTALYIFTFKTALACPPTPVECLVQDGAGHEYDLSTLYRPNGWTAYDASKGQTYFINVCRPISNLTATNCPGKLFFSFQKQFWWILQLMIIEPPHDKTNKMACAPSEDSDQPGHPPSLIRVSAVHSMGS